MDTARFYEDMYGSTSYGDGIGDTRTAALAATAVQCMKQYNVSATATVLEVGAGHGDLRHIHPNWHGIEYSEIAIKQGNKKYGANACFKHGDATKLDWQTASVDFLYTFAALEHVPEIEKALQEILRVLSPGGVALLAPAWNCRVWTTQKLQQRPYAELTLKEKIGKALIPLRENILFRFTTAMPARLKREMLMAMGRQVPLEYRPLTPRWDLFSKYPHISDDDAFVCIDAHAAIAYVKSRGFAVPSHATLLKRLLCRGEPVVVAKPA